MKAILNILFPLLILSVSLIGADIKIENLRYEYKINPLMWILRKMEYGGA